MPRSRLWRDVVLLFVLCATTFLATAKGHPWIEADLQVRRSRLLLTTGSLGSTLPFNSIVDLQGPDGRYYDVHGLLNIVAHVPMVAGDPVLRRLAGERWLDASSALASLSGVLINSLSVVMLYILLRGLSISARASRAAAVAFAFGTMLFVYAGTNFEGNLDMLLFIAALHSCFQYARHTGQQRRRYLWWCGLICGIALLGREANVLFIGVIGLDVLINTWRERRVGTLATFVAGMLPGVLVFAWYNDLRTGSPFVTAINYGIIHGAYPFYRATSAYGLLSLIISPGGSIFAYSPMALLGVLGIWASWRRFPRETLLGGSFVVMSLTSMGLVDRWFGLAGWGPRYVMPTLPVFMIGLAVWIDTPHATVATLAKRMALGAVFVWAIVIQLAGSLVNWHARVDHLMSREDLRENLHWSPLMYTVRESQWWDAVTTLKSNLIGLIEGRLPSETFPDLPTHLSAATQFTSLTLDTWWNRLLFEGAHLWSVVAYLLVSAFIIVAAIRGLLQQDATTTAAPSRL